MRKAAICFLLLSATSFAATIPADQAERGQAALTRINLYRAMHGLKPVTFSDTFSIGCINHANYLDLNPAQLANPYTEDITLQGATSEGKAVAPDILLTYAFTGADAVDSFYTRYGFRGFLLASDFTSGGYGDSPGTNVGFALTVIRVGETHSPTNLLSPFDGSKGNPVNLDIILFGSSTSNIVLVSTSVTSAGAPIEHTAITTENSASKSNLTDIVLTPKAALPVNALISVVIDYTDNGTSKHAEWSFSTSESGQFDAAAAATALPPITGGGTGGGGPFGTASDTSDADADGFPANVELAAGTTATDAASTPFSGAPASTPGALDVLKASIKLNFAKAESDSIQFNGALAVPIGFVPTGFQVIVDVAGAARAFSLSDKGAGVNGFSSFKLSKPKDGFAKYKAKLSKGNFGIDLTDNGLTNTTVKDSSVSVPFTVYFNNTVLTKTMNQLYTAKQDKTARTK